MSDSDTNEAWLRCRLETVLYELSNAEARVKEVEVDCNKFAALLAKEMQLCNEAEERAEKAIAHGTEEEALKWEAIHRAEKVEAALEQLHKEFAAEHTAANLAEAACAEMRAALEKLDQGLGDAGEDPYMRGEETARDVIREALSSDAGKGWVSPEEHKTALKAERKLESESWERAKEGWPPAKYKAVVNLARKYLEREGWAPPEVVAQAIEALIRAENYDRNSQNNRLYSEALSALLEVAK